MRMNWFLAGMFVACGLLGAACPFDPTVRLEGDSGIPDGSGTCGNGIREGHEVCDGQDLAGVTCESRGYAGGELRCLSDCRGYDESGCFRPGTCGDGIREASEDCDGTDLGGKTCQDLGYAEGQLRCGPGCSYDTSGCTNSISKCGNGVIEPGEVCDGPKLNGKTCQDFGFAGGHLACKTDCTDYDTAECSQSQCGNGVLDPGEECDNGPGNSDSEPDACRTDCHWAHCGDGVADSGEACDGTDFGGETCESLVAGQGDLACSQCAIDASGCLNRAVGAPCETVDQCAGDRCFTEADRGFPGGYCSQACEDTPCPTGAMCVAFQNGQQEWDRCMDLCSDGTPCRSGYVCGSASNDPSVQFCAPESWQ